MRIESLFNKPKIIAVIGDVNSGKSNLLYHLIHKLRESGKFDLVTYGLREEIKGAQEIFSVEELEQVRDSVIILDEVMTMWDLDNRMAKRQIENTLRLINHNNNILVISGVPNNFRKFIASKVDVVIYKKVTFQDFINGSKVKYNILNYKGAEKGTSILNLEVNKALVYDGLHYHKIHIRYLPDYDTKRNNIKIVRKIK